MSLTAPYFSIGIPTRNRGELVEQAVKYILAQTFGDFELIIADSDETDDTVDRLKRIEDPRLRYFKTRGKTGPENFQFCADQAKGEYFVFLTDRLMLRPHALETIFRHSEARRFPNIRYHCDTFDDRQSPPKIWKPEYCHGNKLVNADEVMDHFVGENDGPELSKIIPMPQLSAIHRSVLEKIKGVDSRPVFAPIVPDMWCCFAQLAVCEEEMLNIGEMLSVFVMRMGAGLSFLHKKDSGTKFLREICKNGELDMEHVPIKATPTSNMIYNDYMRARKLFGGRLERYPLPWPTYFTGVYRNFEDAMKVGVNMRAEYQEWKTALKAQPPEVQAEVKRRLKKTKSFSKLETKRLLKRVRYNIGLNHLETSLKALRPSTKKKVSTPHKTLAEYIATEPSTS